jgi:6-phosphofructokinase
MNNKDITKKNGANRTLGILNAGGDCAGLNAVIASIVKTGLSLGYKFIGFEKGWEGILSPMMYQVLDDNKVRGISHLGGTILKTTNRGRFAGKSGNKGEVNAIPKDILQMASDNLKSLGVEGLIVIGGDGTLSAATQLSEYGVPIVGVPKTIDNDLTGTDATFGFSTAVNVAVEALDKIHTTASSHDRVFIVECMGRHAGWITLFSGLAGNANAVLLPEFPVDIDDLIGYMRKRHETRGSTIIAVAEGIDLGQYHVSVGVESSEIRLHGAADTLMHAIEEKSPGEFEMRTVILGHTQRGGSPDVVDRILAKRFGVAAIEAYDAEHFGHMVRILDNEISLLPISDASSKLKVVTRDVAEYQTARKIGTYLN